MEKNFTKLGNGITHPSPMKMPPPMYTECYFLPSKLILLNEINIFIVFYSSYVFKPYVLWHSQVFFFIFHTHF